MPFYNRQSVLPFNRQPYMPAVGKVRRCPYVGHKDKNILFTCRLKDKSALRAEAYLILFISSAAGIANSFPFAGNLIGSCQSPWVRLPSCRSRSEHEVFSPGEE